MATKIRLQRHGRKGKPIYHMVVTDSRVKRDGKYIERLGLINTNFDPNIVEVNTDSALVWLKKGAEVSDTARNILSDLGVFLRKHLDGGVAKGALTQEEADQKFEAWKKEKEAKKDAKNQSLTEAQEADKKKRLAAETKIKEDRAAELAKRNQAEEAPAEEAPAEEAPAEASEEAPAAEANASEEAPAEEVKAEEETKKDAE